MGAVFETGKDTKRVFIFLDSMPQKHGSGANLRFYSNIRAYLDLGFEVEGIQIATKADASEPSSDLTPVKWTRVIESPKSPSMVGKLMFRAGFPRHQSIRYFVDRYFLVLREVERRFKTAPDAIFHLEGETMASALPRMQNVARRIWSLHDLPSTVSKATTRIACDANDREPTSSEEREMRFAMNYERHIARYASLILCIADYDVERFREWGCKAIEYLPLSIPGGEDKPRDRSWLPDGELRILHLGSVSHLPSYRSLEFIFERIWPLLSKDVLSRIKFNVVGTLDPTDSRARRIIELAKPYSNVVFHGFVEDVVAHYRENDLQLVASTDASGLRTRIIESFAYGLPTVSTTIGARGIRGLIPGQQLLIADDAAEIARLLAGLLESNGVLARIAANGRAFYDQNNSRAAVAESLARHLERHFNYRF